MRRSRPGGKSGTPLDARQKALVEQQEKLREKMDRLERLISEAPKIAEEQEKRRREELMTRSTNNRFRRSDVPVLNDKRFELQVSMARSRPIRKALKAEKRAQRLTFLALAVLLVMLLVGLKYYVMP